MQASSVELWSIASSIVSVLLGILAMALSIYFYVIGRRTESAVGTSLSKIETQTEMLQKITGKQLDRLTRFVTEDRPKPEDPQLQRLIEVFIQLSQPLSGSIAQQQQPNTQVTQELVACYIGLYYYSGVTNYWSQQFLPAAGEFDVNDELQNLAKKVVDQSFTDFVAMAQVLEGTDQALIGASPLAHIFQEAVDLWRHSVKSSADIFLARERGE